MSYYGRPVYYGNQVVGFTSYAPVAPAISVRTYVTEQQCCGCSTCNPHVKYPQGYCCPKHGMDPRCSGCCSQLCQSPTKATIDCKGNRVHRR